MNVTEIENLTEGNLLKTFKRLKKSTKCFSTLIVRDPVDYIDFEVDVYTNLNELIHRIKTLDYKPSKPYVHLSAKGKGITRPTVVLDIYDSLVYRFCIEQINDELFKNIRQPNIRGGIKITANQDPGVDGDYYEKWFKDWMQHQNNLESSLKNFDFLVSTDIASYFENINISVLGNQIRSHVSGKASVLNLLLYFLESTASRNDYEANTNTGLLQEDIDCSRVLAYFFLFPHDTMLASFCKDNAAEYYRFVDDMSITTDTETTARKALKQITESLRKLNLVSSIEKTSIVASNDAVSELFFIENKYLSDLENVLMQRIENNENILDIVTDIENYYKRLVANGKYKYKNWPKILKRFYSLFAYAKSDILLQDIKDQLIIYPGIFSGNSSKNRVLKYLLRVSKSKQYSIAINNLIDYLYTAENLYQELETSLIEILLMLPEESFDKDILDSLEHLGTDIFFSENNYVAQSEYSRALACLLVYKYSNNNLDRVSNHYIKSNEYNTLLKKYMIFVGLNTENQQLRSKIYDKAKREQSESISRFVNLIENISDYKNNSNVKKFLINNQIYIYAKKSGNFVISEEYDNIRSTILAHLIQIYG